MTIQKCPFFNLCGGCKYDFTDDNYRENKLKELPKIDFTDNAIWGKSGIRRRADFAFVDGHFGFYKKHSKDIVDINKCINLVDEINEVLPKIAKLPWVGSGSVLITKCENGIDIVVNSNVPYFNNDFKLAVEKLPAQIIRFTWNDKIVRKYVEPEIKFNDKIIKYPINAFLQPTIDTEQILRDLVVKYVDGAKKVADLFCGLGNFTFATNATGFDIVGNGIGRDLFKKPLTAKNLEQYDVVIMDPPRAGAEKQSKELSKSNVTRIIYVSCNPTTFMRDSAILQHGGYKMSVAIGVDQFVGTAHWEIFSVFDK
nr:class I SAM-dependent RNA methyltransferase [Candidatus Enterousia merdequi]